MKNSRYTESQVTYALSQAEAGMLVGDVCRSMGISEATFYNWRKKYGSRSGSVAPKDSRDCSLSTALRI
jgi:putative transposase